MERTIRTSAKALIIREGKMAAIKIRDGGETWYIMPGGGQEPEETLEQAVCGKYRKNWASRWHAKNCFSLSKAFMASGFIGST